MGDSDSDDDDDDDQDEDTDSPWSQVEEEEGREHVDRITAEDETELARFLESARNEHGEILAHPMMFVSPIQNWRGWHMVDRSDPFFAQHGIRFIELPPLPTEPPPDPPSRYVVEQASDSAHVRLQSGASPTPRAKRTVQKQPPRAAGDTDSETEELLRFYAQCMAGEE